MEGSNNGAKADNAGSQPEQPKQVKPCCVCLPQKKSRDECVLLKGQESSDCKTIIDEYKECMRGYGFQV